MNIDHLIPAYKYGKPVITGSGVDGTYNRRAVDCPTVFTHNGKFYMMHIGFDGDGYQTALSTSDDLLNWELKGTILKRGANMQWDRVGMAGTTLLMDKDLYGGNHLKKWNGKYWLLYHAYPDFGYEAGPAEVGLAWTEDEELLDWHFHGEPVFSWRGGAAWECGGLYKIDLVQHEDKFYLFYNAKDVTDGSWTEQTGAAVSDDLIRWTRLPGPILPVTGGAWDSVFASDPVVLFDAGENRWAGFYFGFNGKNAMDGIAFSDDLLHWTKYPDPIIRNGAEGELDSRHAHKPGILWHNGTLYHFYCACRPTLTDDERERFGDEFRTITVARSTPW